MPVKNHLTYSQRKRQRGTTMLEVLVALLVLSIGLLGLATLQANGVRFNHSAYLRTQSALLMYDIIDSMRANATVARDSNCYVVALSASAAGSCNSVASADVTRWKTSLANQLPSGDGAVAQKGGTVGTVYTVTVQWQDRDDNQGNPVTKTLTIDAEI